jgi:two-component system KDP operon response regulator KdpE
LLIVEDDPAAAFVLAAALQFGQFKCDIAPTAVQALWLIRDRQYDGVLLDLGLPDLDGYQLIQALRFHRHVPIIVVSGSHAEEEQVRALDLGADDFVAKPYRPNELIATIRAVLRRGLDDISRPRSQPQEHEAASDGLIEVARTVGALS